MWLLPMIIERLAPSEVQVFVKNTGGVTNLEVIRIK